MVKVEKTWQWTGLGGSEDQHVHAHPPIWDVNSILCIQVLYHDLPHALKIPLSKFFHLISLHSTSQIATNFYSKIPFTS